MGKLALGLYNVQAMWLHRNSKLLKGKFTTAIFIYFFRTGICIKY